MTLKGFMETKTLPGKHIVVAYADSLSISRCRQLWVQKD